MNDFAFVAIMLAFFVVAGLFVVACDKIIGQEKEVFAESPAIDAEQEPMAA
jgi:hypothetical protein